MTERHHLLVVDDDDRLRKLLAKYLSDHGYMVSVAADAADARRHIEEIAYDLLVIDVMMPGENGLELTRALRAKNRIPILLLTAMGETEDRIVGFESGADDYLVKPFEPRELLLRIASILRRAPREETPSPPTSCGFGRFTFDIERGVLSDTEGPVHLTSGEAGLLSVLARSPGETLSREELGSQTGNAGNLRTVDVQITRLRKKLEDEPKMPRYLQTVRGRGYVLWPD